MPASGRAARISLQIPSTSRQPHPPRDRALAGPLNHRPVGQRIAERHAQLDHVRAVVDRGKRHVARRREVGVARGEVDDKAGLLLKFDSRVIELFASVQFCYARSEFISRVMNPHILVAAPADVHHQNLVLAHLRRQLDRLGNRVGGLQRRNNAFRPAINTFVASSASASVALRVLARPESCSIACSGPTLA